MSSCTTEDCNIPGRMWASSWTSQVGCTSHSLWVYHLGVDPHTPKTSTIQLLLPLHTSRFPGPDLQKFWENLRRFCYARRTPVCRGPVRLLLHSVQKRRGWNGSILAGLFFCTLGLPMALLLAANASVFLVNTGTEILGRPVAII